jgi:hypothetical protein
VAQCEGTAAVEAALARLNAVERAIQSLSLQKETSVGGV